jgi:uncharacterized LabA/DUF88 family protein
MENQIAVFIDFENIALWAEREFFDFELIPLMEYLQSRGPAVVKRAYGDWSRFSRYRDELMTLSIDLIQIYGVRAGKNRADIRLAIDALEVAITRSHIQIFVIVSGDSDFGPLVSKLREYGRYTLGIGPRNITHHLLVNSCDEFVYLETILGETETDNGPATSEREEARLTLVKAVQAHGQRGELPVLAAKLKQSMLLMSPAFNEANFGYSQFKSWLEDNRDLVKLFVKDLQLYVAPLDYRAPAELDMLPMEVPSEPAELIIPTPQTLDVQYRQLISRLKFPPVDFSLRRDVMRDIYRELCERPGAMTTDELLDYLREGYEAQGLMRTKQVLREILQIAFRQRAFDYKDQNVSLYVPVYLADGIDSEAEFIRRAESDYAYAVIRAGLDLDLAELAHLILNDKGQVEYIQTLLDDLRQRGMIARKGKRYLPGRDSIPFRNEPALQPVRVDVECVELPEGIGEGEEAARLLAKTAMVQRSQDFVAAANTYLYACRLQWDAVEKGEPGATLQDLRWYMASYASANAGKLSQVNRDYSGSRPYYLAFFALVQEDDPLWSRMRGLINPMLSYYWANAGRELDVNISAWNLGTSSPAQIAVAAATHPNPDLRRRWQLFTEALAKINQGLLRRIADQIILERGDSSEHALVAEKIHQMLTV